MKNYKVTIAYDGTSYHGWQVQPGVPTIAGTSQACFTSTFHYPIALIGASRTDAGVHALGQVAHFTTSLDIADATLKRAWNAHLPQDIQIRSLKTVDSHFHAQRNVISKTYYYHFFIERPLPFVARYGLYYRFFLDFDKLSKALNIFVGTHDFRSFCTGYEQETTIRCIHSITLTYLKRYRTYRIIFKGPGFLRYMIRRIVGASLEIASSLRYTHHDLVNVLAEANPHQNLPTAPAQGLLLRKIFYAQGEKEHDI
jgi:tRNA pseudouridine38-40 synthase